MSRALVASLSAAGVLSAVALFDAVFVGLTGTDSPISPEHGVTPGYILGAAAHGAAYVVLAGALHSGRHAVDGGSRFRKGVRLILTASLVTLGAMFLSDVPRALATGDPEAPAALAPVGGIAFALMFLTGLVLGVAMWRRPGLRPAAGALIAQVPALALVIVLGALGSSFAHPAPLEVANAVGIALVVLAPARRPAAVPSPALA